MSTLARPPEGELLPPGATAHSAKGAAMKRARILAATVRLLLALLRASGYRLTGERLPEGETKASILRAITSAQPVLPLNLILRIVGLSPSRYHAWSASPTPAASTIAPHVREPCPPSSRPPRLRPSKTWCSLPSGAADRKAPLMLCSA